MVSLRSSRKSSSYQGKAKFQPVERTVGFFKCVGERCQTISNVKQANTFAFSITKEEYKINHYILCNEKCLIYLLTSKVYLKQHVVQAIDGLRLRWNYYKWKNRKHQWLEACMQEHLFDYFYEETWKDTLEDVLIIFVGKIRRLRILEKRKLLEKSFEDNDTLAIQ